MAAPSWCLPGGGVPLEANPNVVVGSRVAGVPAEGPVGLPGHLGFGQQCLVVVPWPLDFSFGISLALAVPSGCLLSGGVPLDASLLVIFSLGGGQVQRPALESCSVWGGDGGHRLLGRLEGHEGNIRSLFSLSGCILLSVSGPNFVNSVSMSFLEVEWSRFRTSILPGSRIVSGWASMVPWWFLLDVPSVVAYLWMPSS